ncbi:MAG TPA: hypothetical protein VKY74_17065 [Chloroflexia bacterium]|nr:hypothetical protein [Chloroflexia bacterium]
MDEDELTERVLLVEEKLGEAYELLTQIRNDLKAAGRKKDFQALNEVLDRLGRYGRMLGEMRESWGAPVD